MLLKVLDQPLLGAELDMLEWGQVAKEPAEEPACLERQDQ